MNIDRMKVAIRPMSTPQALDLGIVMARHWFIPLWQIWIGMALPIYLLFYLGGIILNVNFAWSAGAFGGVIFWWLKPLYEKPMVAWLGQALFSETPKVKTSVKSGWRSAKAFSPTLLLTKRLSFQRQLIMPILLLERPDKAQFKSRLQILSRGQGGGLGWHTIVLVHIEAILCIAILILFWQLVPTAFIKAETLFTIIENAPIWAEILWALLYFLAASIVAPFFVAGGFAVYLTKRCLLEGWDVELVFKQLRRRYEHSQVTPLAQLNKISTAGEPTSLTASMSSASSLASGSSIERATSTPSMKNSVIEDGR